MFLWYALLYSVIEGFAARQIRLRGAFKADVRAIRERLREGRHAIFHVGTDDSYYDMRLFKIMELRHSAATITRAHKGFGRLLLETLRERDSASDRTEN
jgi:hypothetical protein